MTLTPHAQPFAEPLVDWFFQDDDAAKLGLPAGLSAETARRAIAQGVPLLLREIVDYAQTPLGGHQIAEAVGIIPHFSSVQAALNTGYGALDLERAGQSMAPTLLREHHDRIAAHVAAETHADPARVRQLFDLALPLILSRLNWRDAWALGVLPLLGTLPAAQDSSGEAASGLAQLPNAAVPLPAQTVTSTVIREEVRRRSGFPWWLLPLLLLLLLGGCWLLRPRQAAQVQPVPTAAAATHQFGVTSPAGGTTVTPNGFRATGTGQPGQVVSIYRDGQQVGTFTVDQKGQWATDILDPQAAGNVAYEFRDPDGKVLGTLPLSISTAAAPAAPVSVTSPRPGDQVAAGGFSVAGTGQPDATYQVYEDGVSIGTFKVAPDGTWSVDVPGPTPGDHSYTVLDDRGNRVALLPLKVASAGAASCTGAPTISLADNETVTAPFRFGGQGRAKTYTVSVWRGERQVGQRDVKLTPDCTWSYSSDPGGKSGQQDAIRYEVRPAGTAPGTPPSVKATLHVSGSGTNFNSKGEYVGPTK